MTENEISGRIIANAIEVYKSPGPGLLESASKECLSYKLSESGLLVVKKKAMPLVFERVKLECGYRIDLLVENINKKR